MIGKIVVSGACLQGNCDCGLRNGQVVEGAKDMPPFHDGCTCVVKPLPTSNRLDEIQKRHKRVVQEIVDWKANKSGAVMTGLTCLYVKDTGHLLDLLKDNTGYLLDLLKEYPASEPPDDERLVIVYWEDCVGLGQFGDCVWWVLGRDGRDTGYPVDTWRELPPRMSQERTPEVQEGSSK